MEKISVTILSGFLGSGKTSLLNHIIRSNTGRKIAIIENEFGEINIDSELVISAKDDIYELTNGCVCCSLNTELLQTVLELRDKGFDHVILETTGIADPGQVAATFLFDEDIQNYIQLNAIITLVDAKQVTKQLETMPEVHKQIGYADVLVLNKLDLVDENQKQAVKRLLGDLNTEARVYEARHGAANIPNLFSLNMLTARHVLQANFADTTLAEPAHQGLVSYSFIIKEPLIEGKLSPWLMAMLFLSGAELYRVKGILSFENENRRYVFQAVGQQYMHTYGEEWAGETERVSKIVFIGRKLNRQHLAAGLYGCVASAEKKVAAGTFLRR